MSGKGRYIITLPSLHDDDYQFQNMASFIKSKKYGKEQQQVLYGESHMGNMV
jgi:hypothetical protein